MKNSILPEISTIIIRIYILPIEYSIVMTVLWVGKVKYHILIYWSIYESIDLDNGTDVKMALMSLFELHYKTSGI